MKQNQLISRIILAVTALLFLSMVAYLVSRINIFGTVLYGTQNKGNAIMDVNMVQEPLEMAVWMWESPTQMSEEEMDRRVKLLKEEGISTIYLRIDEIIDIMELKDGREKLEKRKQFDDRLRTFLAKTAAASIRVEGLGGDKDWAETDKDYISIRILDFIAEYNSSQDYKIAGMQFDIEPHGLSLAVADRNTAMINYLNHVEDIVEHMKSDSELIQLGLGFAIPYWYDGESNRGYVEYKGKTTGVFFLMAGILSQKKNSYLVLMDYRNFAHGRDGSIAHAQTEIDYLSDNYPEVGLVIGQETIGAEPEKITFFGKTKTELYSELDKINGAFGLKSPYLGFAIHEYKNFEKMLLQKEP